MELFLVMKYIEGNHFKNLASLRQRLIEMGKLPSNGTLFMKRDLAIEHAKDFSMECRGKCLVFELDLENSTLIVPTIRADEAKLE